MTLNRISLHDSVRMAPDDALVGGTEFVEPLSSGTANATQPVLTILADGGHVLVWEEQEGYANTLKWERFDSDGNSLGAFATLGDGGACSPSVTAMADGGFAIAYATFNGIEVQRFDAASTATGAPIQADYPSNYDGSPTISGLPDGGFLMTWMGYHMDPSDPWNDGIAIRRFDADGLPLGEPQQVNTDSYGNQGAMSVAVLADGGYVVTWRTQTQDINWSYGVAMRHYDASGQPTGPEVAVSPSTFCEFDPSVTALADGGWVVTWSSDKDDMQDVYGQIYNSDGSLRGGEIHLANAGYQFAPTVSALDDGGFVIAWGGGDIIAQRFDAQGDASGDQFVVNQQLAGIQSDPVLATRPDGGFVVAWQTDGTYAYDPMQPWNYNTAGGTVSLRVFAPEETAIGTPATAAEDTVTTVSFAALDPNGGSGLTYTVLSQPAEGTVVDNGDGTFSFDPAGQFEDLSDGETSTVTFTYRVTNALEEWTDKVATIEVTGANDGPVAVEDTVTTGAGTVTITAASLLQNDNDVEGDTLSIVSVQDAVNGVVSLDGGGNVVFTPMGNGPLSFTYTVSDGHGGTDTQTVTVDQETAPPVPVETAWVGGEQLTEGGSTIDAKESSVAVLSDGGHVLTWREQSSTGSVIKWQRFAADGTAADAPAILSANNYEPRVAALSDGGFAIVYGNGIAIMVQRFDATSTAVGLAISVTASPYSYGSDQTITGMPDGGFLVSWRGNDLSPACSWDASVGIRRFDASGTPLGEPRQVNTEDYTQPFDPAVTVLADGGYVVAWRQQGQASDDIHMRRYGADDLPVGSEVAVTSGTALEYAPAVTALADGGWVLSWASDASGTGTETYAQIYNSDASLRGGEIHLTSNGSQYTQAVSALEDGGFVIAWSDGDILAQRFDANGSVVGDRFTIHAQSYDTQSSPALAARPDGGFVAAWVTEGTWFYDPNNGWTIDGGTVSQRIFSGQGSTSVVGGSGDDLMVGSAGSDNLTGGAGSDTYLAGNGSGADTVSNQNALADGDLVLFGGGIDRTQLWFEQQSLDLKVSVIGTADSVTVKDWFADELNHVDQFRTADGGTLGHSQVQNLITAMSIFAPPPLGQTQLTAEEFQQLQPVIAANWQ